MGQDKTENGTRVVPQRSGPSKNLIEAATYCYGARKGFPGIAPCEPRLDWHAVIAQKDALINELRQAKYADVLTFYPEIRFRQGPAVSSAAGRRELLARRDRREAEAARAARRLPCRDRAVQREIVFGDLAARQLPAFKTTPMSSPRRKPASSRVLAG